MWVRGLKQLLLVHILCNFKSHPMWVRGLKLPLLYPLPKLSMSHPMWVRGLKPKRLNIIGYVTKVAPHVGAWIETSSVTS